MKLPTNETELRLYGLGYADGYVYGSITVGSVAHDYWYKRGYDAGVADYCTNMEDNNEGGDQ